MRWFAAETKGFVDGGSGVGVVVLIDSRSVASETSKGRE